MGTSANQRADLGTAIDVTVPELNAKRGRIVFRPLFDSTGGKLDVMKRWLARTGSGHADGPDVSKRKNEYSADTYATKS